jgi:hypothetical protein
VSSKFPFGDFNFMGDELLCENPDVTVINKAQIEKIIFFIL